MSLAWLADLEPGVIVAILTSGSAVLLGVFNRLGQARKEDRDEATEIRHELREEVRALKTEIAAQRVELEDCQKQHREATVKMGMMEIEIARLRIQVERAS